MNSSQSVRNMAADASPEISQQYRKLWKLYLESVDKHVPQFLVPKDLGNEMGLAALEMAAKRFRSVLSRICLYSADLFSYLIQDEVMIRFDPTINAFRIGPYEHLLKDLPSQVSLYSLPRIPTYPPPAYALELEEVSSQVDISRVAITTDNQPSFTQQEENSHQLQTSTARNGNVDMVSEPTNCFVLYREDKQELLKKANPNIQVAEICRYFLTRFQRLLLTQVANIVAQMWANETEEVKTHYQMLADSGKRKLKSDCPGYIFNPRKAFGVKKRKTLLQIPNAVVLEQPHVNDQVTQQVTEQPQRFVYQHVNNQINPLSIRQWNEKYAEEIRQEASLIPATNLAGLTNDEYTVYLQTLLGLTAEQLQALENMRFPEDNTFPTEPAESAGQDISLGQEAEMVVSPYEAEFANAQPSLPTTSE